MFPQINQFISHVAPWSHADKGDTKEVDSCIYTSAESLRICAILLQPYMPDKMKIYLDGLGVAEDARQFENTKFGSDHGFGKPFGKFMEDGENVFPPLSSWF